MQIVSDAYIEATRKMTRQTISKLVIDRIEYIEQLVSHPQISVSVDSMIGGFPSKVVTFEMYRAEGLTLADKEFEVYRGLDVNGSIEYVLQGIFKASGEDITVNESGNKISVKAYDRAVLFDVEQVSQPEVTENYTYGDYIDFILSDVPIELSTIDYPLKDVIMQHPANIEQGTSKRVILSKFAEIIGCICVIDRQGNLCFSKQQITDYTISDGYGKLLLSEQMSTVNQISVRTQADINDDVVYPDSVADAVNYAIVNNPFVTPSDTDLIKLISDNIIGLKMGNYTIENAVDDYIVDINDIVTVISKNGEALQLPILSYESAGRIKANYKLDLTYEQSCVLENSLSSRVAAAEIKIDRQNAEIQMKVSEDDVCSVISQSSSKISITANRLTVQSDNFSLTENGDIKAESGEIGGWLIGRTASDDLKIWSRMEGITAFGYQKGAVEVNFKNDQANDIEKKILYANAFEKGYGSAEGMLNDDAHKTEIFYIRRNGEGYFQHLIAPRIYASEKMIADKVDAISAVTNSQGAVRIEDNNKMGIFIGTDTNINDASLGTRSMLDSTNSAMVLHSKYSIYLLSSGLTQTSNVPLRITANGAVTVSSSARRYKENITDNYDTEINPDNLLDVGVYQFNYKDEFKDKAISLNNKELSIMADDIAEKFPCAAVYNKDGTIQSWDERPVISAMLKLIQEQNKRIEALERRLSNDNSKI